MKFFFVVVTGILLCIFKTYSCPVDSLINEAREKKIFSSFRSSLSTSYIIQKNFYQNDVRNFLFLGNADYYFKISRQKFIQSYFIKANLGYLKFVDSAWTKYADNWKVKVVFTENTSDKITHDYALSVSSQFLNTYRTVKDAAEKNTEQWRGGFLNPATLDFSYNVSIRFWEYSNVMLGLSAIRILTRPRYEGAVEPKETPFAKTERSFILGYYGMSGEVNVYAKKISENISWDNNSSFFVNGISRDRVSFDFQNNVSFKFLKYLQFRLESQITYDPLHSYHLQYRQEFLVGIFYEQKK